MLFHFLSDFPTRRTSPKVRGTMLSFSLQHQLQASTSLRNEDIGVYEKHPAHGRTLININIVDILVYSARQEPGNMRGMVGSGEGPRISSKSTVLKPPARLWDAALPHLATPVPALPAMETKSQALSALSNKHSIYCGSLKVCGRFGRTDSTFLLPPLPGLH